MFKAKELAEAVLAAARAKEVEESKIKVVNDEVGKARPVLEGELSSQVQVEALDKSRAEDDDQDLVTPMSPLHDMERDLDQLLDKGERSPIIQKSGRALRDNNGSSKKKAKNKGKGGGGRGKRR